MLGRRGGKLSLVTQFFIEDKTTLPLSTSQFSKQRSYCF